jgi:hypothetical protein
MAVSCGFRLTSVTLIGGTPLYLRDTSCVFSLGVDPGVSEAAVDDLEQPEDRRGLLPPLS